MASRRWPALPRKKLVSQKLRFSSATLVEISLHGQQQGQGRRLLQQHVQHLVGRAALKRPQDGLDVARELLDGAQLAMQANARPVQGLPREQGNGLGGQAEGGVQGPAVDDLRHVIMHGLLDGVRAVAGDEGLVDLELHTPFVHVSQLRELGAHARHGQAELQKAHERQGVAVGPQQGVKLYVIQAVFVGAHAGEKIKESAVGRHLDRTQDGAGGHHGRGVPVTRGVAGRSGHWVPWGIRRLHQAELGKAKPLPHNASPPADATNNPRAAKNPKGQPDQQQARGGKA